MGLDTRYRAIFKSLPQPAFVIDGGRRILDCNGAAVRMLGVAPSCHIGDRLETCLPGLEPDELAPCGPTEFERRWNMHGEERHFRVRVAPVLEQERRPPAVDSGNGAVVVITDITERRRQLSERLRLGAMVEFIDDAIVAFDGEGRITAWNPGAERTYGYRRDEVVGQDVMLLMPRDRKYEAVGLHDRVLRGGETVRVETLRRRAGGEVFPVSLTLSPVQDDAGRIVGVSALARDITDRWRLQEARARHLGDLRGALAGTVRALSRAAGLRDSYTALHQQRVARLAAAVGQELGMGAASLETLETASLLHDIGKVSIPAEVLVKPVKLTTLEMALVRSHVEQGWEVLHDVPFSGPVAEVVYQHHERLDGTGYPRGLRGDAILQEARIVTVCDVVEAMSSHRPYRPALGVEVALAEVERHAGTRYAPEVVAALRRVLDTPDGGLRRELAETFSD